MNITKNPKIIIGLILIFALALRLFNLTGPDVITDESLIAIRSIGMIDYLASPYQTTPWEWSDPQIPVWAHLSMHDHPPLVFLIEFFSFKIFGVNLWGLRLPFVLFGVLAVYLIYLIGRELFSKNIGIVAASLMAINDYAVWISRIGLQEAVVIFFSLLTLYFFIKALKNDKYFWLVGLSFGLGLLTKYTIIFVGLAILIYLTVYRRDLFFRKTLPPSQSPSSFRREEKRGVVLPFYGGILLALILFSPVIIYNLMLFKTTGHFDLQLAYLFGQKTPDWQNLMGKPSGGLLARPKDLFLNLKSVFSPIMFFASAAAILWLAVRWLKEKFPANLTLIFLSLVSCLMLLLLIGPAIRFLAVLVPFIVLIDAIAIKGLLKRQNKFFHIATVSVLIFVLAYEIFFSYNSVIASGPVGPAGLAYAKPLRLDSNWWGFNLLDNYLEKILAGKKPALSIPPKYEFLEKIKERAQVKNKSESALAALIIYDGDIYDLAALWIFHRRLIYQGWPIISADDYLEKGKDFFISSGVRQFYFIQATENVLKKASAERTAGAWKLAEILNREQIAANLINNYSNQLAFKIYQFN